MFAETDAFHKKRILLILFLMGLVVNLTVVFLIKTPGYMDAEYYTSGAKQLFHGKGFYEPFLWNYLDQPSGLPHPSHTYWMPLPSILAAGGMFLAGSDDFFSARLLFLPLAAAVAVITALIAWRLGLGLRQGAFAGGLAIVSGFYLPYLTLPESFSLYMLLGGGFFLVAFPKNKRLSEHPGLCFLLGLLAGLMHLSRADGMLWLFGGLGLVLLDVFQKPRNKNWLIVLACLGGLMMGYGLVMFPWYARNLQEYGQLMAPGGSRTLFLTDYNQTFVFPADQLNFQAWWQQGWQLHIADRFKALQSNLMTLLGVQGLVLLFPLILVGGWTLRKQRMVWVGFVAWGATLLVMTIAFPYSGARGGFFHSGSAIQPLFWALVPAGMDGLIDRGVEKRGWNASQARLVFSAGTILICALISGFLFSTRIWGNTGADWNLTWQAHQQVEDTLVEFGADFEDVIMVNNPPGFHVATGFPAVVIPDGDVETLIKVAKTYQVKYLALDRNTVSGLVDLYRNPKNFPGLHYLGSKNEVRYFIFQLTEINQ